MKILLWAAMFLLFAILASTVGVAGMIGVPIAASVQVGVLAMAVLLAGTGIVVLIGSPPDYRA